MMWRLKRGSINKIRINMRRVMEETVGKMEKEKTVGIKIFGWFFIILLFLDLIVFPKIISSYDKLRFSLFGVLENINFLHKLYACSIAAALAGFLLFFITGIGILKVKRWGYYIALFIPFAYFMGVIQNIWLFGPQIIIRASTFSAILVSIIIIFFSTRKNVIEQFNADYITKKGKAVNPKRFVLSSLIIVLLANAIPIISWILLVNTKFREQLPAINLKPRKIEYRIEDNAFVSNNCERRDAFDFSLFIPKDWKIGRVSREDGFNWNLSFVNMENSDWKAIVILDSQALVKYCSQLASFLTSIRFMTLKR